MGWVGWLVAAVAIAAAVRIELQRRALAATIERDAETLATAARTAATATRDAARMRRDLDRLAWVTAVDARQPTAAARDELTSMRRSRGERLQAAERQMLDMAISNTDLAVRLLDQVQEWALAEPPDPDVRMANLREVLDVALVDLDHDGNATMDVQGLPDVRTDVGALASALLAVLDNCLQYRWPGRPVHIRVTATSTDRQTTLHVSDDGIGIDLEDPDLLFLPFARGDGAAAKPGIGLGLARARRTIEALGGSIFFAPHDGRGSTVAITLPTG